jgi:hypothetical protein
MAAPQIEVWQMLTAKEESLRDEFAKQAMVAIAPIAWEQSDRYLNERDLMAQIAKSAYEMADEMLAARMANDEGKN